MANPVAVKPDVFAGWFDEAEDVHLPTGGGSFSKRGHISLWGAMVVYEFMCKTDPKTVSLPAEPYEVEQFGESGYFNYRFRTDADAKACMSLITTSADTSKDRAQEKWVWRTKVADVKSMSEEAKTKWRNPWISYACDVNTLGSATRRHAFHMITLPSAVWAKAKINGYDVPDMDFSDILVMPDQFMATDELQFRLTGNPDAKADSPNHYTNSLYWQQRAALWLALGEPDATKYQCKGTLDFKGKLSKYATDSEALSQCLKVVQSRWTQGVWAQVVEAYDPRVDAKRDSKTTDAVYRTMLPLVQRFFKNEAEAKAAVAEQQGGATTEPTPSTNGTGPATATGAPAIPADWADMADDFVTEFTTRIQAGASEKDIMSDLGIANLAVTRAWKKYLKL